MTKLTWNTFGENIFEIGIDRGVLYPNFGSGVVWNGLVAVKELPSGGEVSTYYIDGFPYLKEASSEEAIINISAYTYPDVFAECDGTLSIFSGLSVSQQDRSPFDFCYRTKIGNDANGIDYGYKIHLIYNALAAPSDRGNETINNDLAGITFSWDVTTTKISIPGYKPSAHLIVDSRKISPEILTLIEDIIYGTDGVAARMIRPDELISMFNGTTGDIFTSTFGEFF